MYVDDAIRRLLARRLLTFHLILMTRNQHRRTGRQRQAPRFHQGPVATGVVLGGGLGDFYFGYDRAVGSPLRVGVIGTGDEGSVLLGAINPEFLQVFAIADIRPYNVWRAFHGDHFSETAWPPGRA